MPFSPLGDRSWSDSPPVRLSRRAGDQPARTPVGGPGRSKPDVGRAWCETGESDADDRRGAGLRVLQIASSRESFFHRQVRALEGHGVDCTTVCVPSPASGNRRGLREYATFLARLLPEVRGSFDLVHANYGLVGPVALALHIRPVVLTLWGSELMGFTSRLDRISRFAARHSTAVIVPSDALSRRLDCPHTVVPFHVDADLFRPMDRDAARERLGWDADERIVLFPYPPDRAVKNYPLARRVVDDLSIDAELRTVSGRPYREMPLVMNACDALLVTSRRESGPMVVREAAACNLPVVSTDVGFVSDLLDGVRHSHVCSSRAELAAALESVLTARERSNGRDAVDAVGLDRMGEAILDVYESVLDDPNR